MRHTRIIVTHYGGPDALRVVEEECPEPKDGEVRVRVLAAGVSGSGSVVGGPIDCGGTCIATFPAGTRVTLTARANSGSAVDGWNVPGCAAAECTLALDSDVIASVVFRRQPGPPAEVSRAMCADDCHIAVDEVIPASSSVRDTVSMALDAQGRPRVISPAASMTCGSMAVPGEAGFDAIRDGSRWSVTDGGWERAAVVARTHTSLAALSGSFGQTPVTLRWATGNTWTPGEIAPFDSFTSALVVDPKGALHVVGDGTLGGVRTALHAVWDGRWSTSAVSAIPSDTGRVALAVRESAEPLVAFWAGNPGTMKQTLYVGDPGAKPDPVVVADVVSSAMRFEFGITEANKGVVPHIVTQIPEDTGTRLAYLTRSASGWTRYDLASDASTRTYLGLDPNGSEMWDYDEWNSWPIAVLAQDGDVRVLYTTNHLTGTVTITRGRGQTLIHGGTNAQDLMIAWTKDGALQRVRVGAGFLRVDPGSAFPGEAAPAVAAQVDDSGRIHIVGATSGAESICGSALRYVMIIR